MNATICDRCGKIAPQPSTDVYVSAFTLIVDGSTGIEHRADLCSGCREYIMSTINTVLKDGVKISDNAAVR